VEERVKATVSVCGIGDCGRWIRDACHFWNGKHYFNVLLKIDEKSPQRSLAVCAGERHCAGTGKYHQTLRANSPSVSAMESRNHVSFRRGADCLSARISCCADCTTSNFWLHGDADERVSMEESMSMYKKAGDPKKLVILPGLGHSDIISGPGLEQSLPHIQEWLRRFCR